MTIHTGSSIICGIDVPHLILWSKGLGVGAGEHREGQHGGVQQVSREHVRKYTWHIKSIASIMVRSLGHFIKEDFEVNLVCYSQGRRATLGRSHTKGLASSGLKFCVDTGLLPNYQYLKGAWL